MPPLGQSGVSFSAVGLGGYELGPEEGATPHVDRAVTTLEASLAAGVNWLDTSEVYCESRNEPLLGEALRRIDGELLVSTKAAPSPDGTGFRREEIPCRLPRQPGSARPDRRLLPPLA